MRAVMVESAFQNPVARDAFVLWAAAQLRDVPETISAVRPSGASATGRLTRARYDPPLRNRLLRSLEGAGPPSAAMREREDCD